LKDEPKPSFNQVPLFVSHTLTSDTQKIVDDYTSLISSWQEQATHVQRLRLFTIDELIRLTNLSGRFRVRASHRYTGEALRRCGFKQKRDWTSAGRNKRYWQFDGEAQ